MRARIDFAASQFPNQLGAVSRFDLGPSGINRARFFRLREN